MKVNIVGVGAGPSNLSLASLIHPTGLSNQFIEKRSEFSWHPGLQLPHATLQVSFLKDLVTLADPTNAFSFLAYLHETGRMYQFLNAQFDAITRQEFTQYLHWAAAKNENVCFGEEVERIDFDGDFVVATSKRKLRAECISIAVGKVPSVPHFAEQGIGETMFHSAYYLAHSHRLAGKRIAVVGSGQSGAEVFQDLLNRNGPDAPDQITWVSRRERYAPLDDSPFTNDLFMPCHQDYFSSLPAPNRRAFLKENVLASDGITESTLREIYQSLYLRRFVRDAPNTVNLLPNRAVENVSRDGASWILKMLHGDTRQHEMLPVDIVIWATGYKNATLDFLGPLEDRLQTDNDEIAVDSSFAARWNGPSNRPIFIHNASREQKGLSDPNLSLTAWRSAKMMQRILGRPFTNEPESSSVCWGPHVALPGQALRTA